MPLAPGEWPVIVRHAAGKGESIYVAFDIGRFYTLHGDEHVAGWMKDAVDVLMPVRILGVKGPRTVEVTVWQQPARNRTIIHLANRTVAWTLPTSQRQITEIIPVHGLELSLGRVAADAKVACRGAEIRVRREAGQLEITIDRLEAYAAVIIEKKNATGDKG